MNRFTVLAAIALLWAAIYLPGLGGAELKGEEGRRALPGLAMLDSGDWLVPTLNGEPYLRKPPLINWLIAASVKVTGERNEWAVRLPSVLAMLALALAVGWTGSRWLGPGGGFTAAVFVLASVSFVEKGRLAEIEALYVSLSGIAFAFWLAAWVKRETGWRLWLIPGVALGIGMLTKWQSNLLFFYLLVIPILMAAREKRQLWSRAHFGALGIAFLIFAAWFIPYHQATAKLDANGVLANQLRQAVGGGSLRLSEWLPNFPRAFCNGLPWILFSLLWWNRRVLDALGARDERLRLLVRAVRWPFFIGFVGLMIIPGMLPRYTLPLYPAAALLFALVAPCAAPFWLSFWKQGNRVLIVLVILAAAVAPWVIKPVVLSGGSVAMLAAVEVVLVGVAFWIFRQGSPVSGNAVPSLAGASGLCVAGAMAVYSIALLPRISLEDDLRPIAERVNAAVPVGATLYVVDPGYQAALFYVRQRMVFVASTKNLPSEARYIFVQRGALGKLKSRAKTPADAVHLGGKGKKEFLLLKLSAESEKTPPPISGT